MIIPPSGSSGDLEQGNVPADRRFLGANELMEKHIILTISQ